MPISRQARITRTAISPRFAIRMRSNMSSHAENAEPRLGQGGAERHRERQAERISCLDRIQHAIVPEARRRIVRAALAVELFEDGVGDLLLPRLVEHAALVFELLNLHR